MYTFFFIKCHKIKHFITGSRSPCPRRPNRKIDSGRGVPGRNGFGPGNPGTILSNLSVAVYLRHIGSIYGITIYRNGPERTETDRNGPKRTGTDRNGPERTETDFRGYRNGLSEYRNGLSGNRNGPKRTFVDTETDSLRTETDSLGTETDRNGLSWIPKRIL